MSYTREDLCNVVGCAFEWLIAYEKKAKFARQKAIHLERMNSFNKVVAGLNITFDELPKEDAKKAAKFVDKLPAKINIIPEEKRRNDKDDT